MATQLRSRDRFEAGFVRGLAELPHGVLRRIVGKPVVLDGQQLHIEAQLVLKLLAATGAPELNRMTATEGRAQVASDAKKFEGPKVPVARAEAVSVDGPAGPIAGRLYVPEDRARAAARSGESSGLLVYFHGGGFVVCDLETHDNTCRFLARQAGTRVLAIDYRLAPEHLFPAAIDDAFAAFRFAVEHAAELGADPRQVAVGGDSAGGNLAAGVARLAGADGGPVPAFQLLFYPWVDLSHKADSYQLFGEGFYLTEGDLDWYRGHYLAAEQDALDPRCSPLLGEPVSGLPPAYVATCGFDPLRDEGEAYAARLREQGVPVVLRRHEGLVHGFANTVGVGHAGRDALLEAAGALRVGLAMAQRA